MRLRIKLISLTLALLFIGSIGAVAVSAQSGTNSIGSSNNGAVSAQAAIPIDAMTFHYNAQHTGDYSPVAGNVPQNNQLSWKYWIGGGASDPAVANGVVYIAGNNQGTGVYAINVTTGALLWHSGAFGNDDFASSSPTVANGVVYAGGNNGNVYALNAATGAPVWNFTTGNRVASSPTVANGVVYVASGDLYALNAQTGAKIWNYTAPRLSFTTINSPAVANGVVYAGTTSGSVWDNAYLYAFNATTGAVKWQYWAGAWGSFTSSPAVANGIVYVGTAISLVEAVDAKTGVEVWNYTTEGAVSSTPAVANGVVYVGSDDHNLYALNAATGAKLWNYTTGGYVESSPAYANGVVYVGSDDSNFYALNAATGTKLWNYTAGGQVYPLYPGVVSSPAVANDRVYVESNDGYLNAFGSANNWINAGGQLLAGTGPAATNWGADRTDWFVVGTNHQLYHSWTGHSGWENLGGYLTSSPAATSYGVTIDVGARGSNGALYTRHYSGDSWGPWTKVGGQLLAGTGPAYATASFGGGWFVTGTNHQLYYTSDGGSSWTSLGGYLTSSPAATSPNGDNLEVGARGSDGALYTRHFMYYSWGAWTKVGGQLLSDTGPAAYAWDGGVSWVVTGTNHALYHKSSSGWISLGGYLTSSPAATSSQAYNSVMIYVGARSSNGALYKGSYM